MTKTTIVIISFFIAIIKKKWPRCQTDDITDTFSIGLHYIFINRRYNWRLKNMFFGSETVNFVLLY